MTTNNAVNLSQSGIVVYDGTSTFTGRTITGTANQIDVANGTGISGNPTVSLSPIVLSSTQPFVLAYVNAPLSNKTGNGTQYTLLFNTVLFDQHSDYNSGTGTFTAPVTGKYFVTAQAQFTNMNTSCDITEIYLQSTARQWRGDSQSNYFNSASITTRTAYLSAMIDMTAGDTFTVFVIATRQGADTVGIGGHATNPLSWMSCKLMW